MRGLLVSDFSAPYEASFNTAAVADGPAMVRATAFDAAGNASFAETTFTIDNTAPVVAITSGPSGQTFGAGSTQSWSFTAFDETSGVAAVECSVVPTGSAPAYGTCTGATSHTVSGRPEGSHTFTVRARDGGGLESSQTSSFAIDATPPETTITSGPAEGSSTTDTTISFGFSASEAATFACRLYPAAMTPPAFAACSGAGTHTASGFPAGTYAFEVLATDMAGNVDATSAKRVFTVAAVSPPAPPGAVQCKVPRLKGKTLAQARVALKRANCSLGKVRRAYSSKVRKGRVIKQSPAVGRRAAKGAKVAVVVSRGRRS